MDLSVYLDMVYGTLWYLIPFFIVITVIKSAWFKGVFGEWQVNLLIKLFLNKADYHLIKNVTLPTADGTTQIDHIIVSKYGIFVVETKNMKGWIFGSASQKVWTQKIFKHTSKFQNPLHQNYKHVKTLQSCLGIVGDNVFSVIIFIRDSHFKTEMPDNVQYARGGIEYIKSKTSELLTESEISSCLERIESGRLQPSFKTNSEHKKHVKEIMKQKVSTKTCSKCGSEMVRRKANKGMNAGNEFWGCASFPKCRNVVSC
ncbi:NERD domain-containing protein [Shewanella sp. 202IG2-18]|uniref:nuclease-related domain-containing protein n=1 Tax=Parashewanella hymeniacidonis TaxID=2807618 RepID=UPI00195F720A|nr:NERD domain-containing protein [Parashewanella hymeniacidonis]MBM7072908.1 NERD domain-containing protein [Parashewanella hymeniacidonis]